MSGGVFPFFVLATLTWPADAEGSPQVDAAVETLAANAKSLRTSLRQVAIESGLLREAANLTLIDFGIVDSAHVGIPVTGPAPLVKPASIRLQLVIHADREIPDISSQTLARLGLTIESFAEKQFGRSQLSRYKARCKLLQGALPMRSAFAEPVVARKVSVGALILKGGGVKGLAFAGALSVLEKYYDFRINAGTSAGAIVAVLRGAGYSADELLALLHKTDFRSFLDSSWWTVPFRIVFRGGMHSGDAFQNWMRKELKKKINRHNAIKMEDIPGRTIVFASSDGTLHFDSEGENSGLSADFAVRCSMAIPLFFKAVEHDGKRVVDGGVLNNFPVRAVQALVPEIDEDFVALYLGSEELPPLRRQWIVLELLSMWLGQDERALVDKHSQRTVVIDTRPIHTVKFALTGLEKNYLEAIGRAAALQFVVDRGIADASDRVLASTERARATQLRDEVIAISQAQRKSRWRKSLLLSGLVAAAIAFWIIWPQLKAYAT